MRYESYHEYRLQWLRVLAVGCLCAGCVCLTAIRGKGAPEYTLFVLFLVVCVLLVISTKYMEKMFETVLDKYTVHKQFAEEKTEALRKQIREMEEIAAEKESSAKRENEELKLCVAEKDRKLKDADDKMLRFKFEMELEKKQISQLRYETEAEGIRIREEKMALETSCREIVQSTNPIDKIAQLYEDTYKCIFDRERIGEMTIYDFKHQQYVQKLLEQIFPEILAYVDTEYDIQNAIDYLDNNRSKAKWWLTQAQYNMFRDDEIEMEELALQRYFTSPRRTKWEIGRDYELFYSYYLETRGFKVTRNGINEGLNDFGVDIIAQKGNTIWIIQCKNWGHNGNIHENVVMQTYGSMEYYKRKNNVDATMHVKGAIVTTSELTQNANRVAKELGIEIRKKEMDTSFPAVKCNVNRNGEKIYHLPFDRDYDRTRILNDNECYTMTVREAREKGFRRAYRTPN